MPFQSVCVYCGSADQIPKIYSEAARDMGRSLARRGLRLVYGAGGTGVMGVLANAVLGGGSEVIGVIPALFHTPQLAHPSLTRIEVVDTMHQRKQRMIELADAIIALPGGYGTLDELFEALTWAQIGLHHKPIGLLNTHGFFDPILSWIEQAYSNGFIYSEHRSLFVCSDQPDALLDALAAHQPPENLERWVTREHKT